MTKKIALVLASAGRPDLLADLLRNCRCLEGVEDVEVVVSVPDERSLPHDRSELAGVRVVVGTLGLAAQRNAGVEAVDADIVAFFDDDAVVRPDYLSRALLFLEDHPDVVGLTGRVLLDGKLTGEVPRATAQAVLAASDLEGTTGRWRFTRELYGANFVVRFDRAPQLRFDSRLPLYSWLEDHDFARRLKDVGPLAHVDDCAIVHRAAASGGRQSHRRLGYSQVMNAVYLNRKGSFPAWLATQQIFRPVAKNVALSMVGPAREWRRERLRGNLMASRDVARGRITPERILEFS